MQEALLIVHIFGAAMLLGGGVMALMVGPRMGAAGGEAALGWAKTAGTLGRRYFIPATVLVLLTGIGLVLNSDAYDWGDLFVNIGLGVIIVNAVLAIGVQLPTGKRIVAAIEGADFPTAGGLARKAGKIGMTTTLLVLAATVVMVMKVGT